MPEMHPIRNMRRSTRHRLERARSGPRDSTPLTVSRCSQPPSSMPCGADHEQVCCLEDWVALARRCRIARSAASTRTTTRIPDADAMLAVLSSLGYVDRIAHRRWLGLAPKLVSDSAAITVSLSLFDDDTTVLCFRGKKLKKFTSSKAPSKDAGADLRRAGSRRLV
jgi:hypothetical protein